MMRPWLLVLALAAAPLPLAAQGMHVLLVSGLGGEPAYRRAFAEQAGGLYDVARERWGVPAANLLWLAEDTAVAPGKVRARATKEEVEAALVAMAGRAAPGDLVLVVLIGHGSGEGAQSRVNLPGADPTAGDFNVWLGAFARQSVVVVNAASASGDFADVLAGPGRVIITATRTALERNETRFAAHFLRGLQSGEADTDKDGRVSALEAFEYTTREVRRAYEADNTLLTERARLTDTTLAATLTFGARAASADPRVAALVAERQALEAQVTALRARRDRMRAEDYEAELERLLVTIAEKSAAIRALGGGS